ncbi:hypothetical protein F4827_002497 [Paraburkholderia bannensis]|uniref:Uncharacterized protein n=1 Tax=Paraburkholderia bannensis TaxID=765414 RepID=A0A7W9WR09_9BURK|nr:MULTISPECIES: hypothetical protein [Paraburkholderia]MBB3257632.1 hypothetical protein [Paraburkholderia sp. WP4_3_2]MBB6102645.1 hypothetical protein [Paraburkholderia bannensis]
MAVVIVGMTVLMFVRVILGVAVAVAVAARVAVFAVIVCVRMPVNMTGMVVPRFDLIARRDGRTCACCRAMLIGSRPQALRENARCAPRQENLDHGRFLPKVTESLNSL